MRAFADLLETTAAATDDATNRSLTTSTKVKEALRITDSNSDTISAALIPRATALIVAWCRLARDASGAKPTFARETLRATWHAETIAGRGSELYLPWRVPLFSIDSVVEAETTLAVSTDYVVLGSTPGVLRRISTDTPIEWSTGKIVVTFKAGFAVTTSLATNIDAAIEAACIEQIKGMLFAADRDPTIRSENVPDLAAVSYSVPGGDVMGANVLLPAVRDMLAPWRNPAP
jgi:hypothetical protein